MTKKISTSSLYGIGEDINEIESLVEKMGGEVPEEVEEALIQVERNLLEKTDSYIGVMQKKKDLVKLFSDKGKELQAAENSLKNDILRMEQTVVDFMEKTGRKEIKGTLEVIKPRKAAVKLEVEDEKQVPLEYLVVIPEQVQTKNDEIKKALKNGEIVKGCKLIAGKVGLSFSRRKV